MQPIDVSVIDVTDFGYGFFTSSSELAVAVNPNRKNRFTQMLFFGSMMQFTAGMFIYIDILNTTARFGQDLLEVASLILYDPNVFGSLKSKILSLHGLDISDFKQRFGSCLRLRDKYEILTGIVSATDYRRRSREMSRDPNRRAITRLRSKYPFL